LKRCSKDSDNLARRWPRYAPPAPQFHTHKNEIAAKQDEFSAKQDQLDARVTALTREVRNGLDDYNRKINALNKRLLSLETWLSRIDDRLHEEIIARTR